ncbi:MAG: M23 family metallopeptidase [Merismopedia sp. SIO2A8]|nr:M23 family metallopeptidase [Symploca sp. SIO2B6]NET48028.1 M23 family metallopeptidase [Merismopedia sp. SIO2A8]
MVDPVESQDDRFAVAGAIKTADQGGKSLAIDSGPGADIDPNISQINPAQLAAQIWASASFPVEQFQSYTSPFGYRTSPSGGYRQEFHYGLDIAAPKSSYIRNWWTGTVLEVFDGGSCGTSIVIQSGEWMHMYCHMEGRVESRNGDAYLIDRDGGIQIRQGQEILAGDRIGRVGMTGRTTGPHLHWGLKYQGHWVDPAWVLQAMAASHHALYGQ